MEEVVSTTPTTITTTTTCPEQSECCYPWIVAVVVVSLIACFVTVFLVVALVRRHRHRHHGPCKQQHNHSHKPQQQREQQEQQQQQQQRVKRKVAVSWIPLLFLTFWLGYICGSATTKTTSHCVDRNSNNNNNNRKESFAAASVRRAGNVIKQDEEERNSNNNKNNNKKPAPFRIPREIQTYVVGMSRVKRDEFDQEIHLGVPRDDEDEGNKHDDVLLLYSTKYALPDHHNDNYNDSGIPSLKISDAISNCDYVHVIMTHHSTGNGGDAHRRQCMALVPQSEAFHIHRFGRIEEHHVKRGQHLLNSSLPLRLISRLIKAKNGHETWKLKGLENNELRSVNASWDILQRYTTHLDTMRTELSHILHRIVGPPYSNNNNNNNTVILMTCNFGQSELLINFVCSAHARNNSLHNLLVLALDKETHDLVKNLGLAVYYQPHVFGHIPTQAAGSYGSIDFAIIAMAKIWACHLLSDLGYNFLLQDVDVIWYRNPLDYFHDDDNANKKRDIYYVDDGSREEQLAPFFANTGFFYVVNNFRTRNFFIKLVAFQESVLRHTCDQSTTNVLLSEHASLYGLRVEVLARRGEGLKFLNGYHFHRMNRHNLFPFHNNSTIGPYVFHVCWTKNKVDKIRFLEQLGEWRVHHTCMSAAATAAAAHLESVTLSRCCSAQPLNVKCHMPNRPSIIPSCANNNNNK